MFQSANGNWRNLLLTWVVELVFFFSFSYWAVAMQQQDDWLFTREEVGQVHNWSAHSRNKNNNNKKKKTCDHFRNGGKRPDAPFNGTGQRTDQRRREKKTLFFTSPPPFFLRFFMAVAVSTFKASSVKNCHSEHITAKWGTDRIWVASAESLSWRAVVRAGRKLRTAKCFNIFLRKLTSSGHHQGDRTRQTRAGRRRGKNSLTWYIKWVRVVVSEEIGRPQKQTNGRGEKKEKEEGETGSTCALHYTCARSVAHTSCRFHSLSHDFPWQRARANVDDGWRRRHCFISFFILF